MIDAARIRRRVRRPLAVAVLGFAAAIAMTQFAAGQSMLWKMSWPKTDFTKHSVDLGDIMSGGPPKDGIPSIDDPKFVPQAEYKGTAESEPVISLKIGGEAKAYPLRILIWHEIVNDTLGGTPVSVTFCPLCNSAIVFDRRLDGRVLDFGTTGKLRNSDLVMYDRQTESWWQQFLGQGIVGEMTGKTLKMLPARVESLAKFRQRHPDGLVQVPTNPGMRDYGRNPYRGYDSASLPFLYRGDMPKGIAPMAYVVAIGKEAWPLELIRKNKTLVTSQYRMSWTPGQNSALDSSEIAEGRDIGNLVVERNLGGGWADAVHDLTFAFVFHAFVPEGVIHKR